MRISRFLLGIVLLAILFFAALKYVIAPPGNFPTPYTVTVVPGESVAAVAQTLFAEHAIRSPEAFRAIMRALGGQYRLSVGEYYFDRPVSVVSVAVRLSGHHFGVAETVVTFPEGFTAVQMADRLAAKFPHFDRETFLALATEKEGYLFPDTYLYYPTPPPETVIVDLNKNFDAKIATIAPEIAASRRSERDIVIMASLVQKEARNEDDAPMIAGILWKRIEAGMPLQVDALPSTYTLKGLPKAPIANPGLTSLRASASPTASRYWYYLHDRAGAVHYARTFAEHEANIRRYLSR